MKKGIRKTISIIVILTITFQIIIPIISSYNSKVFAAENVNPELEAEVETLSQVEGLTEDGQLEQQEEVTKLEEDASNVETTEEISRNYEIKEEETWDVSANGDGSVVAKWTLSDRTLTISGTGEMRDWSDPYWHNTQYTYIVENIIIEEGVTSIGNYAFSGRSSLESIEIPEGLTSIGYSAFSGCNSLQSINVDMNNKNYISEDGILFNKDKTEVIKYPAGKKDKTEYTIPSTVISIEDSAFSGCNSLENITIPEGVTSIGENAFSGCSSLKNITIPEGVTRIGDSTFYGCSNLESITIPEGVTSIGSSAFYGCSSLKSITIPEGVTNIEDRAFYGCSSLESIEIPEGVTM